MIYKIFFFIILFSNLHGYCLIFNHHNSNTSLNTCNLQRSNAQGYKQCLRCYINQLITSLDNITIEDNCLPIFQLHCIDLYFNDTKSYKNFSFQSIHLINQLFDKDDYRNIDGHNMIHIHIEYDTFETFSFDTFQLFDNITNRNYQWLQFELKNRDKQLKLLLNSDIQNMTLFSLQINIYCGLKGLYQYYYVPIRQRQPPVESLLCEITMSTSTISNKKLRIIFSLIGGGSLIPCILFSCCLYILCKRYNETNNERRSSLPYSTTDSLSSDKST